MAQFIPWHNSIQHKEISNTFRPHHNGSVSFSKPVVTRYDLV